MKNFLDIHNHILPGLDDGSRNLTESLEMAQALFQCGVKEIIVTPHFEIGLFYNTREKIIQETKKLQRELDDRGIEIILYPGCEVMLTPEIPELLKKGEIVTIKDEGEYVLVEFPLSQRPLYIEDILYEIKIMGIQPIIAHPERYSKLSQEIIEENLLQLNISSFMGHYGNRVQERAERIMEMKEASELFFGTDAHRVQKEIWDSNYINKLQENQLRGMR